MRRPGCSLSGATIAVLLQALLVAGAAQGNPGSSVDSDPAIKTAREALEAGRYSKAVNYLRRHLRNNDRDADALSLMGYSLRKLERFEKAEDYYLQALEIEPEHLGANEYLGELYLQTGRPELARERLAVLERACPESCAEQRELDEAVARYANGEGP